MKIFGKLKLFGLVFILTGALIFVGINFLEAKKPVKETWAVTIPSESINLFGSPSEELSGDNVTVGVKKYKGGPTTGYYFQLTLENELDGDKIGFLELGLEQSECEDYCCHFPSFTCDIPIVKSVFCMQMFLQNQPHPVCNYDEICLIIRVDCNIEDMGPEESIQSSGWVAIDVRNTFEAFEDDLDDYHNIVSSNNVEVINISRAGNAWTIRIVDNFVFQETYRLLKNKKRWEYKIPLTATTPFSFVTTWTRSK